MKILHQRVALLAGASVCALGIPTIAAAATNPGIGRIVNAPSVDDVLSISDIGDPDAVYGVTVDGTTSAFAVVSSTANGAIAQVGNATAGDLALLATNDGTVTIEAIGHADNDAGPATARGHVAIGLYQSGSGSKKSSVELDNGGDLTVIAGAQATGTAAQANATMSTGVLQIAVGDTALVALKNDGAITIGATAAAVGSVQTAFALASAVGIDQQAHGHASASAALANAGTIEIGAAAQATGFFSAVAQGQVQFGIAQTASASDPAAGLASVSLGNSGMIAVSAEAHASAQAAAIASAVVGTAIHQHATGSVAGAAASISNAGTMQFAATATANAHNDGSRVAEATANARVGGIFQDGAARVAYSSSASMAGSVQFSQTRVPTGPVTLTIENSGTVSLLAEAHAAGDNGGIANAAATVASQIGQGSDVSLVLDNSGTFNASALADAAGGQTAYAGAYVSGLHQLASAHATELTGHVTAGGSGHVELFIGGVGPAYAALTNTGTISMVAQAHASVTGTALASSRTYAVAAASAHVPVAINQAAFGSTAGVSIVNDGTIDIGAAASAAGFGMAVADVEANGFRQGAITTGMFASANFTAAGSSGFHQSLFLGDATAAFTNSGSFEIAGAAKATAGSFARVGIHEEGGAQIARGDNANVAVNNSGTFKLTAVGTATGSSELAFVQAAAIDQQALGLDSAVASVVNSGTIEVAVAAQGVAHSGIASDIAIAGGLEQSPFAISASATANFDNSGKLSIEAEAKATGAEIGFAGAYAIGVRQDPLFGTEKASLDNQGSILVAAQATAHATGAAYAEGKATGVLVDAGNVVADVDNSGSITVAATVLADGARGSALAFAGGISMFAAYHATAASAGLISGSIVNSGNIDVSAKVDAANGGTVAATATGIYLSSTRDNATISNSGTIDVEAVTGHGGPANAYGVHVVTGFSGDPAQPDDLFTFTNDGGTIMVRQSTDGGETWQRGMAIDVTQAPNASVINLVGNGLIYGNIGVQAGDEINVEDGKTYFDGIINPALVPNGGIRPGVLDSGLAGVGTLNIGSGGNLVLGDPRITGPAAIYDGPSYAIVDTLNMDANGTLTFELQPSSGGTQSAGSYPQVFANSANLDGKLVAEVTTPNGLFADSYSWQNLIDADSRTGQFDQCLLGGPNAGSLLLNLSCSYDTSGNVDVALTRTAFDAVAGLNANETAVGGGLESVYDVGLTGGAAGMFRDLFLLADPAKYATALDELSGASYANYLQSFSSLGVHYDDMIDHATQCGDAAMRGSALECRGSQPFRVWGQMDYQSRKAGGDAEAGTSRAKRFTGLVGVDAAVGEAGLVGVEGGYVSNRLRDAAFADSIDAEGAQAGLYAAYDPGRFYVKGTTTYSWFNGQSKRAIDLRSLAAGATFSGTARGNPDVNLWTLGLHAGARLPLAASSVATPYLNLDYVHTTLKGFEEDGLDGADLTVDSSSAQRTFLTAGVKWATHVGSVVPEVNLGYRHRFGDARSDFSAAFLGNAGGDFDIVSAAQRRGSFLAGLAVSGKVGPVDVSLGYEGEFNGDLTSHSGNFKLVLPLGGSPRR